MKYKFQIPISKLQITRLSKFDDAAEHQYTDLENFAILQP
jgi:hypothetical protein